VKPEAHVDVEIPQADKTDGASPVPDSVKPEAHVDVEIPLADKTDGASPVPDSVKPEAHVDVEIPQADKTDCASPVPDSVKPEAHVDVSPAPENLQTVVNTVVSKEADAAPHGSSKLAAEDNEKVACDTVASPAIVVTKIRKLRSANSKASPSSEPIPDGDHVTKQESLSPEPVPEDAINEAEDADDALEIFDDDDAEQILQTKMRHGYTHILEEEEPNMEKFILQRKKELADNYELELDEIE